ncbi:uncharacterized protein [Rutidosis leptorrhynchoides]|uniref:uncharacterized protein isoform X2 n=1 Tax=Rutidosis leptorrhynchoides TaxID=125765 RepID=UPI003A9A1BCF
MENGIDEDDDEEDGDLDEEVFEVDHILSICYGDSKRIKQYGLYLKNEAYSTWTGASTSSATVVVADIAAADTTNTSSKCKIIFCHQTLTYCVDMV